MIPAAVFDSHPSPGPQSTGGRTRPPARPGLDRRLTPTSCPLRGSELPMADVLAEIEQLGKQAEAELAAVTTADGLEQFRIKWIGAKGLLKTRMSLIGQARPEDKKAVGAALNALKERVTAGFAAKQQETAAQAAGGPEGGIDVT